MKIEYNLSRIGIRKRYLIVFSFLIFMGLVLSACGSSRSEIAVGDPAPSFTLQSASGEQVSLADYQGEQPVLLFFHMAVG